MREIKFRGKDCWGNWRYGDLMKNSIPTASPVIVENFYYDDPDDSMFEVDSDTVGQFTGLKDADGREIYEGDIVERDNSYFQKTCPAQPKTIVGVVEWCDGEFIVKDSYKLFNSSEKFPIRVIGNIHDNPELLEDMR